MGGLVDQFGPIWAWFSRLVLLVTAGVEHFSV